MDRESADVIEQQMQDTRVSLTDKVAALENHVLGTIQTASESVSTTVEQVKTVVQDTMTSVKDSVTDSVNTVKSTFDVTSHTRKHPWAMVGGAAAVGFVIGTYLSTRRVANVPQRMAQAAAPPPPAPYAAPAAAFAAAPKPPRTGWLDQLLDRAGDEARKLGEAALDQVVASVRKSVDDQLPKLIGTLADRGQHLIANHVGGPPTTNRSAAGSV